MSACIEIASLTSVQMDQGGVETRLEMKNGFQSACWAASLKQSDMAAPPRIIQNALLMGLRPKSDRLSTASSRAAPMRLGRDREARTHELKWAAWGTLTHVFGRLAVPTRHATHTNR